MSSFSVVQLLISICSVYICCTFGQGQEEDQQNQDDKEVFICRDTNQECKRWAGRGECESNESFMRPTCPVSCETCSRKTIDSGDGCTDDSPEFCPSWAAAGFCMTENTRGFMTLHCPVTCRRPCFTRQRTNTRRRNQTPPVPRRTSLSESSNSSRLLSLIATIPTSGPTSPIASNSSPDTSNISFNTSNLSTNTSQTTISSRRRPKPRRRRPISVSSNKDNDSIITTNTTSGNGSPRSRKIVIVRRFSTNNNNRTVTNNNNNRTVTNNNNNRTVTISSSRRRRRPASGGVEGLSPLTPNRNPSVINIQQQQQQQSAASNTPPNSVATNSENSNEAIVAVENDGAEQLPPAARKVPIPSLLLRNYAAIHESVKNRIMTEVPKRPTNQKEEVRCPDDVVSRSYQTGGWGMVWCRVWKCDRSQHKCP